MPNAAGYYRCQFEQIQEGELFKVFIMIVKFQRFESNNYFNPFLKLSFKIRISFSNSLFFFDNCSNLYISIRF